MLYHYTDRDSAADIIRDKLIRAHPVRVRTALIGGEEIELAPAAWFTAASSCPTVLAKLKLAGWPLHHPGMVWRFVVADDAVPLDLPAWAHPHGYDPQIFRWMLATAHLAGEDWGNWRLLTGDASSQLWQAVQSLHGNKWRDEPF